MDYLLKHGHSAQSINTITALEKACNSNGGIRKSINEGRMAPAYQQQVANLFQFPFPWQPWRAGGEKEFGNSDRPDSLAAFKNAYAALHRDTKPVGRYTGGKSASSFLFPKTWAVGHGRLPDIESSHNYKAVSEYILDASDAVMRLGSPYLRYWIDPTDSSRLAWFLRHTTSLCVELVLFRSTHPNQRYNTVRAKILRQARELQLQFPTRLRFHASDRATDLSYIIYPLRPKDNALCRAMIGFQTSTYASRPFLEFVYSEASPPPLVEAASELHAEALSNA